MVNVSFDASSLPNTSSTKYFLLCTSRRCVHFSNRIIQTAEESMHVQYESLVPLLLLFLLLLLLPLPSDDDDADADDVYDADDNDDDGDDERTLVENR